jgi:hypothetical protein
MWPSKTVVQPRMTRTEKAQAVFDTLTSVTLLCVKCLGDSAAGLSEWRGADGAKKSHRYVSREIRLVNQGFDKAWDMECLTCGHRRLMYDRT